MDWALIGLVVIGCVLCVVVPLAGLVVVGQVLDSMERRTQPLAGARRAQPALVEHGVIHGARHERGAQDLEVDARDAARTEHWLQELIATSGLADW